MLKKALKVQQNLYGVFTQFNISGDLAALQQQARAFAALQLAEKAAGGSAPSTPSPQVCFGYFLHMLCKCNFIRWTGGEIEERKRRGVVAPAEAFLTTRNPSPITGERVTTRREGLSGEVIREVAAGRGEEEVRGETYVLMIGPVG